MSSPFRSSANLARWHVAERRLFSVISRHGIALARTLEQKIADAGPYDQRIHPHILTPVREHLVKRGRILARLEHGAPWYYLPSADPAFVDRRLAEQLPVHQAFQERPFIKRVGQTLEIAVYRALSGQSLGFLGRYRDLDTHDDRTLYSKVEPPDHYGTRSLRSGRLDFYVLHPTAGGAGIEIKNVRPWLYPTNSDVLELLQKCLDLDFVPVLIARRIPYVTFRYLNFCGAIVHETYNQLLPEHNDGIADLARRKDLLGFHDIRVGNHPDRRLLKFVCEILPAQIPLARVRYDRFKDILLAYATGKISWEEFVAKARRRRAGSNEDHDEVDDEESGDASTSDDESSA